MGVAYKAAATSPDRSTQNGAVIIHRWSTGEVDYAGLGCNRFPRGVDPDDDSMHLKPLKYEIIAHAERSAIFAAAHDGRNTKDATMVCCWAPCAACAQAIIAVGIATLVVHQDRMDATPERWKDEVTRGMWLLRKAKVNVCYLRGPVNAGVSILFNGERIEV